MNLELLEFDYLVEPNSVFFFDLDGTLINTDMANFNSYKKAIFEVLDSDCNLQFHFKDRFTRNELGELFPRLKKYQIDRIIELKEIYYEHYLPDTSIIKPVFNILNTFCQSL